MKIIKTRKTNLPILVDDGNYEWLSNFTWGLDIDGYAITTIKKDGKPSKARMHRMIMGDCKGKLVDHINGKILDNRKCNLRLCTNTQNQYNAISRRGISKYKGVSKVKKTGKWWSRISVDKTRINLGVFKTEEEAAIAYNIAAIKYHGEFAKLNKVAE